MIGTGGIGSGTFFELKGNHTLGRNESRAGTFLNRQDFCKLHIISHYVSVFLNTEKRQFKVLPTGKVGSDSIGTRLLKQMTDVGIDVSYVKIIKNKNTLFSVCFQYPDSSGGNITTDNSASSFVSISDVKSTESYFKKFTDKGIALAMPEVPLEPRIKILELGTKYHFFRVCAFTSLEAKELLKRDILKKVDLLTMNIDEAESIIGDRCKHLKLQLFLKKTADRLISFNPRMKISLTMGSKGVYGYDGGWKYTPCVPAKPISTAGAGDAHLAGLIIAMVIGLPFINKHNSQKKTFPNSPINSGMDFASLLAFFSVVSPDTINLNASPISLYKYGLKQGIQFSEKLKKVLNT